ncbi:alkaline phosphatase family protein [Pseudolysinimonas sp.]|uniref:alkaline phosphatase family protein n=1 Tax=Pseudolysinimonas sp. TaxID=2680009 RepID=UPI003F7CE5D7
MSDRGEIARRAFLAGLGLAAGGILLADGVAGPGGGGSAWDPESAGPGRPARVPAYEHLVVLMLENRSFDHLLGRLYADGALRPGQRFEGVPRPAPVNAAPDGTPVAAYPYSGPRSSVLQQPTTNAGEELRHVTRQLYGGAPARGRPSMSGFVADYVDAVRANRGRAPTFEEYRQVMGGFAPDALPVLATLARSFGVYDHWFAAVPSDTFCNRSFVHAATSHGFVTNAGSGGYAKWWDAPAVPTVFDRLREAGLSWRVYYDATQAVSLTGILSAPSTEPYWKSDFRSMEQFHADARDGRLPAYAFIEPRMIVNRNSMHPPTVAAADLPIDGTSVYNKSVADMLAAEALVAEVYESIRTSRSSRGSNAQNTTLVITFDEAGGLFDHVPPPAAVPPDGPARRELGFGFDRLGCRVPAIVVSAWTDPGTVLNGRVDHTSIVATICAQHGLAPLTDRDAASRPLFASVTRAAPRPPSSWPVAVAPRVPVPPTSAAHPPTSTALGMLGLVLARFDPGAPRPVDLASAADTLADHGAGLFGTLDRSPRAPSTERRRM